MNFSQSKCRVLARAFALVRLVSTRIRYQRNSVFGTLKSGTETQGTLQSWRMGGVKPRKGDGLFHLTQPTPFVRRFPVLSYVGYILNGIITVCHIKCFALVHISDAYHIKFPCETYNFNISILQCYLKLNSKLKGESANLILHIVQCIEWNDQYYSSIHE